MSPAAARARIRPLTRKALAQQRCWWGLCDAPCTCTVADLTHGYAERYGMCDEHAVKLEDRENGLLARKFLQQPRYVFLPASEPTEPDAETDDEPSDPHDEPARLLADTYRHGYAPMRAAA